MIVSINQLGAPLLKDGDHLTYEHGYVSAMHSLTQASVLHLLSYPESALRLLNIELTHEERLTAVNERTTQKLILQKLQERF